jgi:lambda repressor-like predicted transcriptional regulator
VWSDTKEGDMPPVNDRTHVNQAVDPLVRVLLAELDASGESLEGLAVRAGLGKDTIASWARARRVPNIGNMRAALGAVGLELVAIRPAAARQGMVVE